MNCSSEAAAVPVGGRRPASPREGTVAPAPGSLPAHATCIRRGLCRTAFALVLASATGCGTLLHDDFEGYGEGEPVGGGAEGAASGAGATIPGTPLGDRILPLGCKDELYVVSSVGALSGQRSLVLEHARLPHCEPGCSTSDICEDPATIRFVPIPPDAGSGAIHFSWSGRLDSELEDTVVSIRVEEDTADLFTAVVELEVQADRVEVRQGGVSLDGQVDHDFSTLHGFFLQVSFADGTYQVQVAGAGLPAQTTGAVAPCTLAHVVCGEFAPANFAPDKIRLSIQFDPAKSLPPSVSATVRPKYHVDDVRISQTRK